VKEWRSDGWREWGWWLNIQCESKNFTPLEVFWNFFPNGWEFLIKILQACYSFILTLNCKILFNYPQLWQIYAVLSATTQWIFTFHQNFNFNCTDFTAKDEIDEWPPNSPDLNPLDYNVWGAMLQAFHKLHPKPKTIPELKSALQQIWDDLP